MTELQNAYSSNLRVKGPGTRKVIPETPPPDELFCTTRFRASLNYVSVLVLPRCWHAMPLRSTHHSCFRDVVRVIACTHRQHHDDATHHMTEDTHNMTVVRWVWMRTVLIRCYVTNCVDEDDDIMCVACATRTMLKDCWVSYVVSDHTVEMRVSPHHSCSHIKVDVLSIVITLRCSIIIDSSSCLMHYDIMQWRYMMLTHHSSFVIIDSYSSSCKQLCASLTSVTMKMIWCCRCFTSWLVMSVFIMIYVRRNAYSCITHR